MSAFCKSKVLSSARRREVTLITGGLFLGAAVGGLFVLEPLRTAALIAIVALAVPALVKLLKLDIPTTMALVLVLALLAPPWRLSQFPDIRPEQPVVLAFPVLIFMAAVAAGMELPRPTLSIVDGLFLLYALCVFVSIIAGYLFLRVPLSYHDFMEFAKIGLYYCAFRIGMRANWQQPGIGRYAPLMLIAVIVVAAIAISQAYNLLGVNDYLSPLYIEREFILSMVRRTTSFRVAGTIGNPNHFGFMETMVVSFLLSAVLFCQQRLNRIALGALLSALALSLFCIFLTASRTATVAVAGSAAFILATFLFSGRTVGLPRRLLSILLALALVIAILPFAHDRFFSVMRSLLDPSGIGQLSTVEARVVAWRTAMEQIRTSPIVGWGMATGNLAGPVDNDYLLLLRQFGIVGLAVLVLLFTHVFRTAGRLAAGGRNPLRTAYGRAVQGILVALALYSFTAGAFENQQLMVILWILVGGLYALIRDRGRPEQATASSPSAITGSERPLTDRAPIPPPMPNQRAKLASAEK